MLIKLTALKTTKPKIIEPKTLPVWIGSFQVNNSHKEDDEVVGIDIVII